MRGVARRTRCSSAPFTIALTLVHSDESVNFRRNVSFAGTPPLCGPHSTAAGGANQSLTTCGRKCRHPPPVRAFNETRGVLDRAAHLLLRHVTIAVAIAYAHPFLIRVCLVVDFPIGDR